MDCTAFDSLYPLFATLKRKKQPTCAKCAQFLRKMKYKRKLLPWLSKAALCQVQQ
jgi:hypothetical protein